MELVKHEGNEMFETRHPDSVLGEAALVGRAVDRLVRQRPDLVHVIGGRRHPRFELLQIVAAMFRCTARVTETRRISAPDGWEAVAEVVHVPTGTIVARGEGMCTVDEPLWRARMRYEIRGGQRIAAGEEPVSDHQRRAMAQTRACSRALRLALGWVLGLAGYEPTAAEELPAAETEAREHTQTAQIRRRRQSQETHQPTVSQPAESAATEQQRISREQRMQLWAAARAAGLSPERAAAIMRAHGYERSEDVRQADLPSILQAFEQAGEQAEQQMQLEAEQ